MGTPKRHPRRAKRRRQRVVIAIVVALVVCGVTLGVLFGVRGGDGDDAAAEPPARAEPAAGQPVATVAGAEGTTELEPFVTCWSTGGDDDLAAPSGCVEAGPVGCTDAEAGVRATTSRLTTVPGAVLTLTLDRAVDELGVTWRPTDMAAGDAVGSPTMLDERTWQVVAPDREALLVVDAAVTLSMDGSGDEAGGRVTSAACVTVAGDAVPGMTPTSFPAEPNLIGDAAEAATLFEHDVTSQGMRVEGAPVACAAGSRPELASGTAWECSAGVAGGPAGAGATYAGALVLQDGLVHGATLG